MLQSTLKLAGLVIGVAVVAAIVLRDEVSPNVEASLPSAGLTQQAGLARTVPVPAGPSSGTRGTEILSADRQGHFAAGLEVNGVIIPMLVDTGATIVSFSAEDAERAGLHPSRSEFRHRFNTANGEVAAAVVKIDHLRLNSIELNDVEAAILPEGALSHSLLGMSFLKRLAAFQVEGSTLILRQ